MERAFFECEGFRYEYATFGQGTDVVIAFHGFGREAADFNQFAKALAPSERFISINLFQHGNSTWPQKRPLTAALTLEEHASFLQSFLKHLGTDRFSLFAYSLGGKIAMQTCLLFPERIDKVLLIAPDGLKTNRFYRFIVGTSLGRKIFAFTVTNPGLLLRSTDVAFKTKLIHAKLHRFVYVHMDTEEKRKQVYETWLIYRNFVPNLDQLAFIINQHKFDFKLIVGKHDSVIKAKDARRFARKLNASESVFELNAGHQLMNSDVVNFIRQQQLW